MKTIRCFLALKLDIEPACALADAQRELRNRCIETDLKIHWVPPPNMHVTIRFLGQVTEPMAGALQDRLGPVLSRIDSFELVARGLGAFPDVENPRIIWGGLTEGSDQLAVFHEKVSACLTEAGLHLDDKPFRSHVTIGRIKDGPLDQFAACLGDDQTEFGATWVRNLYCYRSDLTQKGAEYHTVWRLPLAGSARRPERPRNDTQPSQEEGLKGDTPHDGNEG